MAIGQHDIESPMDTSEARGETPRRSGFTWRALVIGLLLIPPNVYWVEQMEMMRYSAHPTTVSLFFNAVFILLALAALNALVAKASPRLALTQAELLMVYTMICIASCICGHDWIQVLMPIFSWSFWMATPENKWETLFNPDLPKWLTVQDLRILRGYYEGGDTMYRPEVLAAWWGPVTMWSLFIIALILVMLGLTIIVRRQWLEGEHLACPLVNLPVEISEPKPRLFTQSLFWAGFGLAAGLDTYNSIAFLYPAIPRIPIEHADMAGAFRARPWSAIGWFPRSFYPFVIGMGYLMPMDFLFSCWFFYLFWKAELILSTAVGWDKIPQFPFSNFQCFGAYALFAVSALWMARGYLRQVWLRILGAAGGLRERNEAMSYRGATIMALIGFVFLVVFSAFIGLRAWLGVVFFVIYFGLSVAITRMRAQFGAPVHDLHFTGPDQILTATLGTRIFPKQDLITFALYWWFNRAYRNHPMPHMMEAMRMQDRARARNRGLVQAILVATLVALVSSFWSFLHMYYDLGATAQGRMFSGESFPKLATWLVAPTGPNWYAASAIGVGFVFASFLQTMRLQYMWWPFHPLGFAISSNWEMNLVWMPLLIAWLLKTVIVKYGGHKTYQRCVPIFMGLILGQFVVGSILNIVSIILHVPSYMFWQ
ncbi:MAG: hypothetical protein HPY69_09305 [Armatimonadetes bacterium]|nr:hypothetical protein [Armatimonadota bacterium]